MEALPLLDELMANAWRPTVEETHGGWRYRWADGVTRRANSVLARETHERVEALVDCAEGFYRERGAPTLISVSTASAPRDLAAHLQARGYRSTARTLVQQAVTRDVTDRFRPTVEIEISETPTEEWFRVYWSAEAARGRGDSDMVVFRDLLLVPGLPTLFAAARRGSEVLGVGQLVIEQGWGGVQCMATDPSHRGQGVARAVLNGLAMEAARHGVGQMYLAVMADNFPARALYGRSGFRTAQEYCYFTDRSG